VICGTNIRQQQYEQMESIRTSILFHLLGKLVAELKKFIDTKNYKNDVEQIMQFFSVKAKATNRFSESCEKNEYYL
jgi:hypothetical protein